MTSESLAQFAARKHAEVDRFVAQWREHQAQDCDQSALVDGVKPCDQWPGQMSPGDWDGQFETFLET